MNSESRNKLYFWTSVVVQNYKDFRFQYENIHACNRFHSYCIRTKTKLVWWKTMLYQHMDFRNKFQAYQQLFPKLFSLITTKRLFPGLLWTRNRTYARQALSLFVRCYQIGPRSSDEILFQKPNFYENKFSQNHNLFKIIILKS